jgi:inosine triphosphate pyrophosphatase
VTGDQIAVRVHSFSLSSSPFSKAMTRAWYLVALLFACPACGFSSNNNNLDRRREFLISMIKDDVDGAGSWRSKAKDYQAKNSSTLRTLEERKRLNIAFVTGNAMKQREINIILSNNAATSADGESLVNLRILDVDLPEIQEINTEAVAKNKAIQGAQLAGGACVVEDTSLEFNALGGMPGPFIKWFQDSLGSEGLYKILQAYEDKSATAVCTLAFCPYPHADPVLFTGRCTGTIVEPVEGRGFGWDSIFVPDGQTVPFSCMKTEQKCELSHRSMAVMKWADWLGNNINELYDRQYGKPAIGHKGLDFRPSSSEQ